MLSYKNLNYEIKNHIAIITINHPPANTWNLATMEDFEDCIERASTDTDVRVVIITGGKEKCFSAGFDVSDAANADIISPKGRELWRKLDRLSKPTIAVINGHALGGGLELALSCHFRIMVDNPKTILGLTELNLGIIPGWGGTQRLPRIVGRAKALDMIFFSKRINVDEALKIGLIDRKVVSESLMDDAIEFAEKLANRPPIAVQWMLDAFSAGLYDGLEKGLEIESLGSTAVRSTEDRNEGFKAFMEKRKPQFKGR
ncbi:enoyl-CoA hydratase-related protein [Desulfobacula sp.]|uniref:enoyl-CoA hydratase/isomerase family protein n=1 Tax=Desulfobacula sp. TaxID=2593537 RepID=UPI002627A092|nr:enoyl-CoA hydratase-related protein [Desulfobacula sp.]